MTDEGPAAAARSAEPTPRAPGGAGGGAPPNAANAAADPDEPVCIPIEDALDLHTFRPSETAAVVEEYLREAAARGFTEVRLIHGRGTGVQREIVRAVLSRSALVTSFADAPPQRGGWGATLARLRVPATAPGTT